MSDAPTDIAARKQHLRNEALVLRDGLDLDERLDWDREIAERALELPALLASSGPISAYWPMRSEADPRPILEALHERGLSLCLPAIVSRRMIFRRWAPWEPIVPGGFGTLVPAPGEAEVAPSVLLVPLAAFDRRGYRIGYGKGHYDAALSALPGALAIGVAYAAQEIEAVPEEPHDRRLAFVVTDREIIACG